MATTTTDLNVRQGPGQDYPILDLLPVGTQVEVTGKNADGTWWQVAFPPGSAERGWIFASFTRSSNTEGLPVVETPIPPTLTHTPTITPTATASPTSTSTPTATPTLTPTSSLIPIVEFGATKTTINPGDCTSLQWHIENVNAAYLNGGKFSNQGITGPLGSIDVCPTGTTLYLLRAETDSGPVEKSVTVTVRTEQVVTLNHTSSGSVREDGTVFTPQPFAGDNDTNQALRGFFAFDLSSLADSEIIEAQLDLSGYDLNGNPFEWLQPLRVEEVDWGSTLDAADFGAAAVASLATMSDSVGLDGLIDVTGRVVTGIDGGRNSFRIRLRFETATNGDSTNNGVNWAGHTAQLTVRYYK